MIIYKAENKINGHVYIGQTSKKLEERIYNHQKDSKTKRYNSKFMNAYFKYGFDNFEWSILCETDSREKLNALEKFYISAYRKMGICYNMTDGGDGASGHKLSEETRRKISEANKGRTISEETKNKISIKNTGKTHSLETREKLSKANKGKIMSEESKIKIGKASIGNTYNCGKTPWNKGLTGVKLSEEHRAKISEGMKGRVLSEESRKKISESNTGKTHSPETRQKLREANLGKKHSEETKRKMSETHKRILGGTC
jgi:group I intron endonuclease